MGQPISQVAQAVQGANTPIATPGGNAPGTNPGMIGQFDENGNLIPGTGGIGNPNGPGGSAPGAGGKGGLPGPVNGPLQPGILTNPQGQNAPLTGNFQPGGYNTQRPNVASVRGAGRGGLLR